MTVYTLPTFAITLQPCSSRCWCQQLIIRDFSSSSQSPSAFLTEGRTAETSLHFVFETKQVSFRYKRAAFYSGIEGKIRLIFAKAAALRININKQHRRQPCRLGPYTNHMPPQSSPLLLNGSVLRVLLVERIPSIFTKKDHHLLLLFSSFVYTTNTDCLLLLLLLLRVNTTAQL